MGATGGKFAETLLRLGYVDEAALKQCIREQERLALSGTVLSLGQILIKKGLLTVDQLMHVLLEQGVAAEEALARPADNALGAMVLGRYDIIGELGHGGMGVVFKAKDRDIGRVVAIKVLRQGECDDLAIQRLRREAVAAGRLRHPNIVTVFDIGKQGDLHYIVMEYVEGESMQKLLAARKLTMKKGVELLERVARAVHFMHRKGIIHRDLSPGNIVVEASGRPVITDFGLARLMDASVDITRSHATLGTPYYMAPEQVRGGKGEIDGRADVYALGAILYRVLTGAHVHEAETLYELYRKIVEEDPEPPRKLNREVPADLEYVCLKALSRDRSLRHASAREFADDLARWLAGKPVRSERGRKTGVLGIIRNVVSKILPARPAASPPEGETSQADAARPKPAAPPRPQKAAAPFKWSIDGFTREEVDWTYAFAERAYRELVAMLGVAPAKPIPVRIRRAQGTRLSSQMTDDALEFEAPYWTDHHWTRTTLLKHMAEWLVESSVARGWPKDWWYGNFGEAVACQVFRRLGFHQYADRLQKWNRDRTTFALLVEWLDQYGADMFQRTFLLVRRDGMDWRKLGTNPSRLLTHYVLAYLCEGAGLDLATPFAARHKLRLDYTVEPGVVRDIRSVRSNLGEYLLTSRPQEAPRKVRDSWERFRRGRYEELRKLFPTQHE